MELLEELSVEQGVEQIASIPLNPSDHKDSLIWHYDKRGQYTIKSGNYLPRKYIFMQSSPSPVLSYWKTISELWVPGF